MPRKTAATSSSSATPKPRAGSRPRVRARKKEAAPAPNATIQSTRAVQRERARVFAIEAARLMADDKCNEVVVLDVGEKSSVTDYLVIGSGTSDRQMRAVLHHVEELGAQTGYTVLRTSSDDRATWLLADFVNVVVHLFEPNTRAHYDLEMMWGDATRLSWQRRGTKKAAPAASAEG